MASHTRYRLFLHRTNENLDRFIPNRGAMDFGYAHYMLTEGWKEKQKPNSPSSPSKEAFRKCLKEACGMNRPKIFAFRDKPPAPLHFTAPPDLDSPRGRFRRVPQTSQRALYCPDLIDNYYLNLLDWGESNVLAVALRDTVYLWNATTKSTTELVSVSDTQGPVTSLSWAQGGRSIAVGLNNSTVQLWDASAGKKLRTLRNGHEARIGSLAWNRHILTTGSADSKIINNDVRVRNHAVEMFRGHKFEVCGLKWSPSGRYLASGGNDNLLHIFDRAMTGSDSATQCLQQIEDHRAAVKALAWCPFQSNMLASGGGMTDQSVKFWNIHTGACLNSVDTGSQVTALIWSKDDRELVSSHGFPDNQMTLWNYPSMVKMAELSEHTSRVLYMCQSPDGSTIASAGGDETLLIWNVFRTPEARPSKEFAALEPFANVSRIR